ncbi:putative metalloprotease CJM1_0395 family protein [Cellvibrio sp. ARAG 10.3]|uniref:putative metalloprotease CJM1_0395 family protein n=1 Tax=Cellvibrio sp. ARAG 10.3 TaxID=3451358 RepID=UPI003F47A9AC
MITNIPSSYANAVAPFAPLGRQAVSEEGLDLKSSNFKALEQSAESARGENRRSPDERPNEVGERERLREGRINGDEPRQHGGRQADSKQARQEQEQQEIRELAARDREVRSHEQAHAAVGGKYAGSPVYEFVRGPDGVSYAVGGEVSIDTSPIPGDPEATIAKAQQIRRAANAPAEPSSQDRRVAAEASLMEADARAELRQERVIESERAHEEKAERAEEKKAEAARKEKNDEAQQVASERAELQRAQRAEALAEASRRNIDINRRLLDIGVNNTIPVIGSFLDRQV